MSKREARCVMFITADQWRAEALSALGHACARTPNLDALAADGVLFTHHYGQCSPCGPARASLLTGLYMMNHRSVRNGTPLDARHTNVALEARKAGYDPVLFGYTDTSLDPRHLDPADPRLRGYCGVLPGMSVGCQMDDDVRPWRAYLQAKGYEVPREPAAVWKPAADARGRPCAPYIAEDSDTAFLADQVLRHLSVHLDEPWFVHAVFLRPHPPLVAPAPYHTLVDPADVPPPRRRPRPADEATQHPYLAWLLQRQTTPGYYTGHRVNMQALDEREQRALRAVYHGLIAEVDHHVGRIVRYLKETGQYERTLIVFTVDHGEMLGDHHLWGKEGYFDQAYRVPLIVRAPGVAADAVRGRRVEAFTEAVDVMPTILQWLGLEVPVQCDGESLLPFLAGETPARWRDEVHYEFDFRDVAGARAERALGLASDECTLNVVRDQRYKYVHFTALPPLLFDLHEDPDESVDRSTDPACREVMLAYAQRLLSWRMAHADRALSNMLLTGGGVRSHSNRRRGPPV